MGKTFGPVDGDIEAVARVLEPSAWFRVDQGGENRLTKGRIERSIRMATACVGVMRNRPLPDDIADLLEEARQALSGVVALDEEDQGPDGESQSCAVTAAKIKIKLAANERLIKALTTPPVEGMPSG